MDETPTPGEASDDCPPWVVVEPFPGAPTADRERVRVWSLVLEARGIAHRRRSVGRRALLWVAPAEHDQAVAELRRYEAENRFWPPSGPRIAPPLKNERTTFAVLAALGLFHDLTLQPPGRVLGIAVDWHRLGALDVGRVLDGQWWRLVTALTLHADGLHVLGNLVLGGLLFAHLNNQLGVGLGVALAVAAGTLGNLTNALVREPSHQSLGASTAVFAALGALAARAVWGTSHRDWRRWAVPLGAGAGLVALVGVGDESTDYLAHLFGFGWGLVAGALTHWPRPLRQPPGRKGSLALGLAALALVAGAWTWALRAG